MMIFDNEANTKTSFNICIRNTPAYMATQVKPFLAFFGLFRRYLCLSLRPCHPSVSVAQRVCTCAIEAIRQDGGVMFLLQVSACRSVFVFLACVFSSGADACFQCS